MTTELPYDGVKFTTQIRRWALELGFQAVGIADLDLSRAETHLQRWLDAGFQGEMAYMSRHGRKRTRPAELIPGTVTVISARMNYRPDHSREPWSVLEDSSLGYVSRYALGRDYHKVMRTGLKRLAVRIQDQIGPYGYRVFSDSAPVMEKALAEKAGLGWIGKHSNLLNRKAGSWFFLGEIYTDLPLPTDRPGNEHCGTCRACLDGCPTGAIVAPYQVDARRCISYLTIELRGSIPPALRRPMGNRIYGCDDCQLVCPWNRFAPNGENADFRPRHDLDAPDLIDLFKWTEGQFLTRTEGSAIRRIGHACWLRNIAVALGNAAHDPAIVQALQSRLRHHDERVREHVIWALAEQAAKGTK